MAQIKPIGRMTEEVISARAIFLTWTFVLAGFLCLPAPGSASPCPDAVIGNPNLPASIQITAVPAGGNSGTVRGVANNVDTSKVRVSGWAQTDRYYPQPFLTELFTCIGPDGSWSYFTHPFERVIVLLVDDTYVGPAGPSPLPPSIDYHPSTDQGVLAWAEIPPSRTLLFAGEKWWVKDSAPFTTGPGPCVFSPSAGNVFVDDNGLHLKILKQAGTWTCAEVVLDRSRGHGIYTFQVSSALDMLDAQEVFGGFLFESLTREIDIECSPVLTGASNGCQYVVQPFSKPGNRVIFPIPTGPSSHRISWRADQIEFLSWRGLNPFPPAPQDVIKSFVYTGPDIPPPGNERMRFNLWLFNGASPQSGVGSEITIWSFRYDCPLEGCPGTNIVAAALPLSRSHQMGTLLTAFATIINAGSALAVHCRVQPPANPTVLGPFMYRMTDPMTNLPTEMPNTPAGSIAAGGSQTFVFGFTPSAPIPETSLAIRFQCDNTPDAPQIAGVNDLIVVTDLLPVPDTIALVATPRGDGVVRIPSSTGVQPFAIATANVGATGSITVSADTGGVVLPVTFTVCETNAMTGLCLVPPTPTVTVTYAAGTTQSFAFFAQASGSIPFDPGVNRVFARLKQDGVTRGATSAAVCTTPNPGC